MKILLMDLDVIKERRPFPNLALMKLSAYHKAKGDEVFLNFPLCQPDTTYASCVFTWNARQRIGLAPDVIIGGSGIDLKTELPAEVEHILPDYSLYPNVDFSLGFTSRGCPRRCPWCIVPVKEGMIMPWARIYEFWDRQRKKILLLDNNLLAADSWRETMEDLISEDLEVDFYQGLDIRLVNEEKADYLARLRTRQLRFAFDDIAQEKAVRRGIKFLLDRGIRSRKLSFYVLVGFGSDNTALDRMKLLHSYNVDVYPMVYKGPDGKEPGTAKESMERIGSTLGKEGLLWHGSRRNINKFLRVVGRLPE